jgi:hypothetical protein
LQSGACVERAGEITLAGGVVVERTRDCAVDVIARARSSCEAGRGRSAWSAKKIGSARPEHPAAIPAIVSPAPKMMLQTPVAWRSGVRTPGGTIISSTSIAASRNAGCVRSGKPSTTPILTDGRPGAAAASAVLMTAVGSAAESGSTARPCGCTCAEGMSRALADTSDRFGLLSEGSTVNKALPCLVDNVMQI